MAYGVIYKFIKPSLLAPCQTGPAQIAKKIVLLPMWTVIGIGDFYYNHVVNECDAAADQESKHGFWWSVAP